MMSPHQQSEYIERQLSLGARDISQLWAEMDVVWHALGLDNRRPLSEQMPAAGYFYGHPIWIVNGLFAERDPVSRGHRVRIAEYVASLQHDRTADYGGGSGVLARIICDTAPGAHVDIVEPYPFDIFREQCADQPRVRYVPNLGQNYDVVIAQDVLEHVDDPIGVAIKLLASTRVGGHAIFANAFHPFIECHLPTTFYLRYQFNRMLSLCGATHLGGVPGAEHAHVFHKRGEIDADRLRRLARLARLTGPVLNGLGAGKRALRRVLGR